MHVGNVIKKLLRIENIIIKDLYFEQRKTGEALVIRSRLPKKKMCRCGICGKKAKRYDNGQGLRRWRALDFGTLKVYIEAPSRRVQCLKHGVVTERKPWARHGSWFTADFEDTVAWLTLNSSIQTVANLMRVEWKTVGHIAKRVYDDEKSKAPSMFNDLVNIGIDETSYKKGHKYMTIVVNHDTSKIIWAKAGHGKGVLNSFFATLTDEQKASIRHVSADGASWIAECVAEHCPNALRCLDTFHVVQWATEALDEVRRGVWREAREGQIKGKKTLEALQKIGNRDSQTKLPA